jgi:hypothetical protein
VPAYLPPRLLGAWASALAAADLDAALVRGLRSTADAFVAAGGDVTLAGARVCERALAAALFAVADADGLRRTAEEREAARLVVSLDTLTSLAGDWCSSTSPSPASAGAHKICARDRGCGCWHYSDVQEREA